MKLYFVEFKNGTVKIYDTQYHIYHHTSILPIVVREDIPE